MCVRISFRCVRYLRLDYKTGVLHGARKFYRDSNFRRKKKGIQAGVLHGARKFYRDSNFRREEIRIFLWVMHVQVKMSFFFFCYYWIIKTSCFLQNWCFQYPKEPNMGWRRKGSSVISVAGQHGRSIKDVSRTHVSKPEKGASSWLLSWVGCCFNTSPLSF